MGSLVRELIPHPDSKPTAIKSIKAGVGREDPQQLFVMFKLEGDLSQIKSLDPIGPGERLDGLWKTTCFECFVRDEGKSAYREYNFSPKGDWAAYEFSAYREGMTNLDVPIMPHGFGEIADDWMSIAKYLRQPIETEPRRMTSWQIALSAVIEQTDGTKSYWALAHPPGDPDFHHPDGFALELPPPVY